MRRLQLLLIGLGLLLAGCGSEKTDIMFACASPSGDNIATLYRVSSGERPGDQEMKLNLRAADSALDQGMHSFSFRHGYDAIITWITDDQLQITYPLDSEITHQEMVIFGSSQTFDPDRQIKVAYQDQPSTHGYFMVEKRCLNGAE